MSNLTPPSFNLAGLPEEEFEITRLLWNNLCNLSGQVSNFKIALELADYCDAQRELHKPALYAPVSSNSGVEVFTDKWRAMMANSQFVSWKRLAARDGAITLYNFAETKQTIDNQKVRCSSLFPHIDKDALKRANVRFNKEFPDYADIRLTVAHAGKLSKSEDEDAHHRIPGSNVRLTQMLTDRRLASSVNDKIAHYDLTTASYVALKEITEDIYRAYRPAAEFTATLPCLPAWKERAREWREKSRSTEG